MAGMNLLLSPIHHNMQTTTTRDGLISNRRRYHTDGATLTTALKISGNILLNAQAMFRRPFPNIVQLDNPKIRECSDFDNFGYIHRECPLLRRPFTIIPPAAKKPRKQVDTTTPWDYYRLQEGQQNISLKSLGVGPASEWIYSLTLTLEELLIGKHCSFPLSRSLVSGATKNVILEIDIPPGCRKGTRILCRGVGHEQKDGSRQDIAFIIEELNHDHFSRVGDDLILEVKVPYDDSLRYHGGHFMVGGLDGQKLHFCIDSLRDRAWNGRSIIKGAGMPVRRRGQFVGRGNLVVQYVLFRFSRI